VAVDDRVELLLRGEPVGRWLADPRGQLSLETRHPDHEELVEIGAEDRQELDPLEQRRALVHGFMEDARVEVQPGELPIEIRLWALSFGLCAWSCGGHGRGREALIPRNRAQSGPS
jgi:hypothetical protein